MYHPIHFLLVEDQRIDELALLALAADFPNLKHIATAHDAGDAVAFIKNTKPDLVFMDIDIPGGSGIELVRLLRDIIPMAVFVTSHGEYALDGFELSALDYVVKPYTEERFAQTVKRVQEYWTMKHQAAAYEALVEKETLLIKEGYDKIRLQLSDIIYLEAMQDYTKVVTNVKRYMVNLPLSGFLEQLPANKFLRIHRSYAVLRSRIKAFKAHELTMGDDIMLPIGKTYRSLVHQAITP